MPKGPNSTIFTVTINKDLENKLKDFMKENTLSSRSEAVKFILIEYFKQSETKE